MKEPWSPHSSDGSQGGEDSIRELLTTIWPKNRNLYPGWLVTPLEVRLSLINRTGAWQSSILRVLNSLSLVERIDAIRELVWRHEITLEPIPSELESAAQDAISKMSDAQTNSDLDESDHMSSCIREARCEVALTLVTVARYRLDEDAFIQRIETARQFLDDNADVGHRIYHERCLWSA